MKYPYWQEQQNDGRLLLFEEYLLDLASLRPMKTESTLLACVAGLIVV